MRLLSWITLPPLTLGALYLAVANRQRVLFNLDPFNPTDPALALDVPLFVVVLFCLFLGIVIGGFSAWFAQGRWRQEARKTRKAVQQMAKEEVKTAENSNLPAVSDAKTPR